MLVCLFSTRPAIDGNKTGPRYPSTITSRSTSTRVGRYVLVLSETALVLVIESSLKRSYVCSTHALPLTETNWSPVSENDNERKHKHESAALRARARNRKPTEVVAYSFNTRPAFDGNKTGPRYPSTITSRSTSTRVRRFVLVLSATVLVLVIESSLKWPHIRSAHDLPMTEAKLVRVIRAR